MNGLEDIIDLVEYRRTGNDFRWASRRWTQMPYCVRGERKKPKEIVSSVLRSQSVQQVIRQIAKEKMVKEEEVANEAKLTLVELAHDYHLYAIRWFGVILSKLSKRLYHSIQVDTQKLHEIKRAYESYPVLLLPTHRSYVDFLLVSYLSFTFNLTLPIIAAGMDFKGMAGVGEMLRKSGAFYIRRRFGGDPMYWTLISEYVKTAMLEGGHPLEMFVEGTRSRTGKSLKPKIGLLSIITELVSSGQIPDILILPISMSYDRTLEERLYAHELLGQPKPKESTNGLMKALKWLGSQSYGSVYVNFGNLISIRDFFNSRNNSLSVIRPSLDLASVQDLALEVVLAQQQNLAVPLMAGISLVVGCELSRSPTFVMPVKSLLAAVSFLESILISRQSRFGYPYIRESLEVNVRYIISVHSSLLILTEDSGKDVVTMKVDTKGSPDDDDVVGMIHQHYANQILNSLFPLGVATVLLSNPRQEHGQDVKEQEENILADYTFLREILEEDFLYQKGSVKTELDWAVTTFCPEELEPWKNTLLRYAFEPYFIAYWGVTKKLAEIFGLTPSINFEVKDFSKDCQIFLRELMASGKIIVKAYGALSLETISTAVSSLVRVGALERIKIENGSFAIVLKDASTLASVSNRLDRLLGGDWNDTERHSGTNWIEDDVVKDEVRGVLCSQKELRLRSKL